MDPYAHTFISTVLCAVFFYSGYLYAYWKLRQHIIEQAVEAMMDVRIVIEDDDENSEGNDKLG
jgi:cbb3-type cytochrome oxidase subunit 3